MKRHIYALLPAMIFCSAAPVLAQTPCFPGLLQSDEKSIVVDGKHYPRVSFQYDPQTRTTIRLSGDTLVIDYPPLPEALMTESTAPASDRLVQQETCVPSVPDSSMGSELDRHPLDALLLSLPVTLAILSLNPSLQRKKKQ